jgi:DNA-binding NarL/FixJ family response regulator
MSSTSTAKRSVPIRVLVINNTVMDSQLMADALSRYPGFQVRACLTISEEIISRSIDDVQVALISAEPHDPNNTSYTIVRKLRLAHPTIRSIVLLNPDQRALVIEAFRSGAKGVFCRNDSFKSLCKCIRQVHEGQVWANSHELRYVLEALSETSLPCLRDTQGKNLLSKRESDIVNALAQGLSNREIAAQMKLSEHTVKNYLFRIFNKLGISSRVELILYAFSQRESSFRNSELPQ